MLLCSDQESKMTSEEPPEELDFVTELREYDVLMGRGSPSTEYSGNLHFRQLVKDRREDYLRCTKRQEKHQVAQEIVETVHQRGGRFLEKIDTMEEALKLNVPPRTQAWRIVPASSALFIKVKQLMRDVGEETKSKRKERREAYRQKARERKEIESKKDRAESKSVTSRDSAKKQTTWPHDAGGVSSSGESANSAERQKRPTSTRRDGAGLSRDFTPGNQRSQHTQPGQISVPSTLNYPASRPAMQQSGEISMPPIMSLQVNQVLQQPPGASATLSSALNANTLAELLQQQRVQIQRYAGVPSATTAVAAAPQVMILHPEELLPTQGLSMEEVNALYTLVYAPGVPQRIKQDLLALLMNRNMLR